MCRRSNAIRFVQKWQPFILRQICNLVREMKQRIYVEISVVVRPSRVSRRGPCADNSGFMLTGLEIIKDITLSKYGS